MDFIKDIFHNVWLERIFWSVIVALVGIVIYVLFAKFLTTREKRHSKIFSNKKNKTFLRMLRSIAGYAITITVVFLILQIFGVNITSMLAGVGIASIVVGFALQDALKDIIRGFDIVSDNYYNIGDIVKYGDNTGQVLSIGLRTTKLQDINSMNIVSIANRNIDQIEVVSEYIYLSVPLPLELKSDPAEALVREIADKIKHHKSVNTVEYQGITSITGSAINYQIAITCDPADKLQVRRTALHDVVVTLEENKVPIPHDQLDIHARAARLAK